MWVNTRPRRDLLLPTWQRGYRVHGYWLYGQRVGHVGLSPRGLPPVVYKWVIDENVDAWGEEWTLRAAKRRVESAFRRLRQIDGSTTKLNVDPA